MSPTSHRPTTVDERKPLVYIAAPYTRPDPVENTHKAIKVGVELYETGLLVPFVPHVSLLTHLVVPKPYTFWLDYDIAFLAHCHAIYRLRGESSGADDEVQWAFDSGIPIFFEEQRESLLQWARWWDVNGRSGWDTAGEMAL